VSDERLLKKASVPWSYLVSYSHVFRKQQKPQQVHEVKAVASSFMDGTADLRGKFRAKRTEMTEMMMHQYRILETNVHGSYLLPK
jgi:hypothetical protein